MQLADFAPEEVVNWIEKFDKDNRLLIKTLRKALEDVPLIEYWVHTHIAAQKNNAPEDLLARINDLVKILLALYVVERQQKN